MKPKNSSDFCENSKKSLVWHYFCFRNLDFLQNNKNCIVLTMTALMSVIISLICIHTDNHREYIPSPPAGISKTQSVAGQERYYNKEITDGKINIAIADADTLDKLYGIGEALSEKIINQREKEPFHTIEDIMKVSGIGLAKFEKIKDKITLGKE